MRKFPVIAMLAAACVLSASESVAETILEVSRIREGVYMVYDPSKNTTVYVKDVEAYIKQNYSTPKVEGFGGKLSATDFAKGSTPVADAAKAAAVPLNYAAGTAYNVANMSPSWRKATLPIKALFGMKKKPAKQPSPGF